MEEGVDEEFDKNRNHCPISASYVHIRRYRDITVSLSL